MNMWLLKLHFAISILCLITFIGFRAVFKEQVKQNGWINKEQKKNIFAWLGFFVPILNVLMVLLLFVMILLKKEEFEKMKEENKNG